MPISPDIFIFITFLLINFSIGLACSRNVHTIREYAIGNRNFSTATISATLIATAVAGSTFAFNISGSYTEGLYFIIPALGDGISYLIIAFILAPKLGMFFNRISVADAMGSLYGDKIRVISALLGSIPAVGTVAVQFTILTEIIQYFLDISPMLSLMISALVIISYASLGGIKAVTFTDVIQFIAFGVFIPLLIFIVWHSVQDKAVLNFALNNNELWTPAKIFNADNPKLTEYLFLFFFFAIPAFDPAVFQRVVIAKNVKQIKYSFAIAGTICTAIYLALNFIGFLLSANGADIDTIHLIPYLLAEYTKPGLKIAMALGLMAMIMSTADSYLNSSSIMMTNDFLKPIGFSWARNNPLLVCRLMTIFIGICAVMLSLSQNTILDILLLSYGLYMPVVSVPLLFAIMKIRNKPSSVLLAMLLGSISLTCIKLLYPNMDNIIIPMILNGLFLFLTRIKEPSGNNHLYDATGADNTSLNKFKDILGQLNHFSTEKLTRSFSTPCYSLNNSKVICYLGGFCMVFILISIFSTPYNIISTYESTLYNMLYAALCCSTAMIMHPLLPREYHYHRILTIIPYIALGYLIVTFPVTLVGLGHHSTTQIAILGIGVVMLYVLMHWRIATIILAIGITSAAALATITITNSLNSQYVFETNHWQAMYIILAAILLSLLFIHPMRFIHSQGYALKNKWPFTNKETKYNSNFFFKPLNLEPNTANNTHPLSENIGNKWTELDDSQLYQKLHNIDYTSSKFSNFMGSLLTFIDFVHHNAPLHKQFIQINNVIDHSIMTCNKMISESQDITLETHYLDQQNEVYADTHYLTLAINNIICNAINNTSQGCVTITVQPSPNHPKAQYCNIPAHTLISITDEGEGIKSGAEESIFLAFDQSHNTHTERNGIGLALSHLIIQKHGGYIWAENNSVKGATVHILL